MALRGLFLALTFNFITGLLASTPKADVKVSNLRTHDNKKTYNVNANEGEYLTFELKADLKNLGDDNIPTPSLPLTKNFQFLAGFLKLDGSVGNSWPKAMTTDDDESLNDGQTKTIELKRRIKFQKSLCNDKLCLCIKSERVFNGQSIIAYTDANIGNDLACIKITCEAAPGTGVSDVQVSNLRTKSGDNKYNINANDGQVINLEFKVDLKNNGQENIGSPKSPLTKNFVYRLGLLKTDGSLGNNWPEATSGDKSISLNHGQTKHVSLSRQIVFKKSLCNSKVCLCVKSERRISSGKTLLSYKDPNTNNDLDCMDIVCESTNLVSTSDVHAVSLRTKDNEGQYGVNAGNGDSVTFELRLNIKNLGPDDISSPQSPLTENFEFRVGILGLDGTLGNSWPRVSSSDSDTSLNDGQSKTVSLKRTVTFSKSYCGDTICVCVKSERVFANGKTYVAYSDPNTKNDLACMKLECKQTDGLIDVETSMLQRFNDDNEYIINAENGETVNLQLKAKLKILGNGHIGSPKSPLTENFVFRVGVLGLDGSVGNNWPVASSPNTDDPLHQNQVLTIYMTRKIQFSKSFCGDKICLCVKSARKFQDSTLYVAYNDPNTGNDLVCMNIVCDAGMSDVRIYDLRSSNGDQDYLVNANNGQTITLDIKAKLQNLGEKAIGAPKSPLEDNFSFRLGLLGLDGTTGNSWPEALSSDLDVTLNNKQWREVRMKRQIQFSKSLCGEQICVCVKATRVFVDSKIYISYNDPNTANDLACMKLVCDDGPDPVLGTSDVQVSNLRTLDDDDDYVIDADNGDSVTLKLKARIKNLGEDDINSPESPLTENFLFLVGILGFDGQIGNNWPGTSSPDVAVSLNKDQSRTITLTRNIKFSKSMCGDRICLCVKPKRVLSNGKIVTAYTDPNTGNDLACMYLKCESSRDTDADVAVNYLRTSNNQVDYEIVANNGEMVTLEFLAELENKGPDDIEVPQSPMSNNFVFRVGVLGIEGNTGNSWPKVTTSDTDVTLAYRQKRIVRFSRNIQFSKSFCDDKICFCNKASRILSNGKTYISYVDPNTDNDLACIKITCPKPNPSTTADVETSNLRPLDDRNVYEISAENGETVNLELKALLRNLGPHDINYPSSPFSDNFVFRVGIFGLDGTTANTWPIVSSSFTDISLNRNSQRTVSMSRRIEFSKSFCGEKICLCTKPDRIFHNGKNIVSYIDPNTENDLACVEISCGADPIIDIEADVDTSNLRMQSGKTRYELLNPKNGENMEFSVIANLRNIGPDDIDTPASPLTDNFVFRLGLLGNDGSVGNTWPIISSPDTDIKLERGQTRTVSLKRNVIFSKSFCGDTLCLCTKSSRILQNGDTIVAYIDPNTENDLACMDIECKYDDPKDIYSDVETLNLRKRTGETTYYVDANNGELITLDLIVDIKNLGTDNIPLPHTPLSDNFAFRVGLLGFDGNVGNTWQKISTDDSDIPLNVHQSSTVSLKRQIRFSKSFCGDRICVCTKAARALRDSESFIAYIDPNTENDLACMDIECETSKVDVKISNLKSKETGLPTYEVVSNDPTRIEVLADIENIGNKDIGPPKNPPARNFQYRLYIFPIEGSDRPKADGTYETATLFAGTSREVTITRANVFLTDEDCKKSDQLNLCVSVKAVSEAVGSGTVLSYEDNNPTNDMTCMRLKCVTSNIQDDPHIIVWPDTPGLKPLCFDLFGKSGDTFALLNDTAAGWSVTATLLDDFYFHTVTVRSSSSVVVVDVHGVKQSSLVFGGEEGALSIGDILMVYDKVTKSITLQTGEYPDDLEVEVKLGRHAFGVKHLDVGIPDRKLTEHVGGILGHVKRNYQNVHEPVQNGQRVGMVVMRNRPFEALLTYRGDVKCWFVKTETALYPAKTDAFIIGQ